MPAKTHLRRELRLLVLATLLPVWLGCVALIWQTQAEAKRYRQCETENTVREMLSAVDREVATTGMMAAIVTERHLPAGWIAVIFDPSGTIYARSIVSGLDRVGQRVSDSLYAASRQEMSGMFDGQTVEGIETTTFFAKSAATRWGVAIGIPSTLLRDQVMYSISVSLMVVGTLAAASLTVAHFAGQRIIRAFKLMADAHEAEEIRRKRGEERALLFAHLSHTMHSPLQVIIATSDLLSRDRRMGEHCERINRAVEAVDRLIDEITTDGTLDYPDARRAALASSPEN